VLDQTTVIETEVFMNATGLGVFDRTIQKTNTWLQAVEEELGLESKHQAYHLLRVVLHEVRDRLPMPQTAHLGAQLPTLLRGVYYDSWSPSLKGSKEHRKEFLLNIAGEIDPALNLSAEAVARSVFRVISQKVDAGEIGQIVHTMPKDIQSLWPGKAAA
jgi:uncharacterized protein (DUF2267 family)